MTNIVFGIVIICHSLFKGNYLKNEKVPLHFLFHFWNLHPIFNIFRKKKIVIANVFLKLQTLKDLVRELSKKRRFRIFFESQHVEGSQTLVKSAWKHFSQIFSSLWQKVIWKISPLFKFEILGIFVNTLTADKKHLFGIVRCCCSLFKGNCLKKEKLFLNFLFLFWKLPQILQIFLKRLLS